MPRSDRFLKALNCQPVDCTPVWIMRQAGRYLPEYRKVREGAGEFLNLCKTPELACEVAMQPLARYDLDAAILFSDILTIPDAMGLGLGFETGEGPVFERPINSLRDVTALGVPDPEAELRYVTDAVRLIRTELKDSVPLIGFAGSPWTLATYMVEGRSSKTFSKVKAMLFQEPKTLHSLLKVLADSVTVYLNAQIKAGAQAVMLFDTWGGVLTTNDYQDFSLNYMSQIIDGLIREHEGTKVPIILFTKNGGQWLNAIAQSGCDAIGIDWTIDIGDARKQVDGKVALQGNMDPSVLYGSPERIRDEVKKILKDYGSGPGHVFNLGHGIYPDIPPENVSVMIDAVREFGENSLPYKIGDL